MSDVYGSEGDAYTIEVEAALDEDECPVCHGLLSEKDGVPWCPSCDLKFTP